MFCKVCACLSAVCVALAAGGGAFVPQNLARVVEIAATLSDDNTADSPPASDRAYWDAEAAKPSSRADMAKAERRLAEPIAETTDALYLEFTTPGNGNRTHYEKPYFDRERGLWELVRGECLEHRGRFLRRIADYLETLCSERTWCMPAHDPSLTAFRGEAMRLDLGAQGRGLACAWTVYALHGELPGDIEARTRAELERRIFVPCRKCHAAQKAEDVAPLWWYQSVNNWTAVCQAGTVRAALMALEGKMDRAAFIEGAERSKVSYLSGFTDDGYCSEGMGYWNYGWGYFLDLASAVRKATGGKVNLCSGEKARKVMEFGFGALICGTMAPSLADGGGKMNMKVLRAGLEFWPDLPVPGETPLPVRSAFPIAQMYVMRPGESAMPFAIGIKGGHNGEFHNHNDVGTYDLYCDGVQVAGDPGGVQYTALTFSSHRYENPILSSYGHPVPVVDGRLQSAGKEFRATVEKVESSAQRDMVRFDISRAYPEATNGSSRVTELRRVFDYDRARRTVRVVDRVAFDGQGTFSVPIITFGDLVPTGAEGTYALTVHEGKREVRVAVKVVVAGSKWHLRSERIDNPARRSPMRHAIVLDSPVSAATVSVAYSMPEAGRALPENVPTVRRGHPRMFFNPETWAEVRAAAEGPAKGDLSRLLEKCEGYPDDPKCSGTDPAPVGHSSSTPLPPVRDWGREAADCALAWRFTGDGRYLAKAKKMLVSSVAAYGRAYENRRAVAWESTSRILAFAAYDWIFEALTDDERRAIIVPFVQYVENVQPGPGKPEIVRRNGGPGGYRAGFYGVDSLLWYSGLAAFGDGFCDDIASRHLEAGYANCRKMLAYRAESAGDDGPLVSGTCAYAIGAYPWAHFNFFHTLMSSAGTDAAHMYPGLALFPNFVWWNWIRDEKAPLQFGSGDVRHDLNLLETGYLPEHLAQYSHFFGVSDPDAARLSETLRRMLPPADLAKTWPMYPFLLAIGGSVSPFSDAELDAHSLRARHFESTGQFFMRSGWSPDATYCLFTAGGTIVGGHRHYDDNGFVIYKRGFLALDSGSRALQDDLNLAHYFSQTVAHNCILVHKPGEPLPPCWGVRSANKAEWLCDGGQTEKAAAKLLAFETNPLFTYIASDAADSYPGKCGECVRQFLFLADDCFVVYDRVSAAKAEYGKEWLLHSAGEPTVDGRTAEVRAGRGALFCSTLLPHGAVVEKVGGTGREFWSNGRNWPLNPKFVADSEARAASFGSGPWFGAWRISVRPKDEALADRFLHVINVSAEEGAKPVETSVIEDSAEDGCIVRLQDVVVEGRKGSLEAEVRFARAGEVCGSIRWRLAGSGGETVASGNRRLATGVQRQAGVFGRM